MRWLHSPYRESIFVSAIYPRQTNVEKHAMVRNGFNPNPHPTRTPNRTGWSGGAKVLGKLPVPGRPTIWMIVGQGPIALAVGAGGG